MATEQCAHCQATVSTPSPVMILLDGSTPIYFCRMACLLFYVTARLVLRAPY